METPRSYVVFKNGVEEDIIYFEKDVNGDAIFVTNNGVYKYRNNSKDFVDVKRIFINGCELEMSVDTVHLDDRVRYIYGFNLDEASLEILASKDATREEILELIASDLDLVYERTSKT